MPTYLLHGFRWPREGFTGVRVHAIVNNLEDCSVEYIQNENSRRDILDSFRKGFPEVMKELESNGRSLDFIEQYDPNDVSSTTAVSQPHAFVADKVVTMAGDGSSDTTSSSPLSLNVEEVITAGPGLSTQAWEALADLRDKIAQGEKIGWWVVYNGDPERAYDSSDEDGDDEEEDDDGISTPTRTTPTDVDSTQAQTQLPSQIQPSASSTKPVNQANVLPDRTKTSAKQPAVQDPQLAVQPPAEVKLPQPKDEQIAELPKVKEVVQKTGFRKKFFGRKL